MILVGAGCAAVSRPQHGPDRRSPKTVRETLAFSSEVVITRKHTRFGESRFNEAIAATVSGLGQYQQAEAKRIEWLRNTELSADRANSLILQACEGGIIGARLLPDVIQQWRQTGRPFHSTGAPAPAGVGTQLTELPVLDFSHVHRRSSQ
ncbi:MAG TPA: hypothetical protein PLF81_26270 [Candidatus Anammoximicrobium sp.]|nr:hypothetical protein [Candidatus Anammoximicrobium sp.]